MSIKWTIEVDAEAVDPLVVQNLQETYRLFKGYTTAITGSIEESQRRNKAFEEVLEYYMVPSQFRTFMSEWGASSTDTGTDKC